jgi:hypothetical protein
MAVAFSAFPRIERLRDYLREELDQHGNLQRALTVYNCGRVKCSEGQKYAKKY